MHTRVVGRLCRLQIFGVGMMNYRLAQTTRNSCHMCFDKVKWSHAGLNRGPQGYYPYALTS